jgi:subtilase family serine protease
LGAVEGKGLYLMLKRLMGAATLVAGLAVTGGTAFGAPSPNSHSMRSCAVTSGPTASCNALLNTAAKAGPAGTVVNGYGPANLQSAYGLTSSGRATETVAIVDAYNDPYAASDLATYRSQFGLGLCAAGTSSSSCLRIVNQSGGTRLPTSNGGWAQEESLDLDMVSAICPSCHILLVEASSASFGNLGTAVRYAASVPGVVAISNSYGGSDAKDSTYGGYYNHPGIAVTASAGDSGYGAEYPASSDYVTAVGGTSLTKASNSRGWSETVWSGTGSGCSIYNTQPSWQASIGTACSNRAEADVSADADPNTGVAVYDSYSYQGYRGWLEFGGTSVASPIIASVYALAGNTASANGGNLPYGAPSSAFNDVTSGSNGSCPTAQWCNARTGWDGPTGLGTPIGTTGF